MPSSSTRLWLRGSFLRHREFVPAWIESMRNSSQCRVLIMRRHEWKPSSQFQKAPPEGARSRPRSPLLRAVGSARSWCEPLPQLSGMRFWKKFEPCAPLGNAAEDRHDRTLRITASRPTGSMDESSLVSLRLLKTCRAGDLDGLTGHRDRHWIAHTAPYSSRPATVRRWGDAGSKARAGNDRLGRRDSRRHRQAGHNLFIESMKNASPLRVAAWHGRPRVVAAG